MEILFRFKPKIASAPLLLLLILSPVIFIQSSHFKLLSFLFTVALSLFIIFRLSTRRIVVSDRGIDYRGLLIRVVFGWQEIYDVSQEDIPDNAFKIAVCSVFLEFSRMFLDRAKKKLEIRNHENKMIRVYSYDLEKYDDLLNEIRKHCEVWDKIITK